MFPVNIAFGIDYLTEKISAREMFLMMLFLATGLVHPMLLLWLSDQGATDPSAMLYILPSYLGKSLVGLHLWYISYRTGNYSSHAGLECLSPSTSPSIEYNMDVVPRTSSIDVYDVQTHDASYCDIGIPPSGRGMQHNSIDSSVPWALVLCLCGCEISSSCMHMIGMLLSGPTLVTLVYSSITITTALISRAMLGRVLTAQQWFSLVVVAIGVSLSGALHLLPNVMGAHTTTPVGVGPQTSSYHMSNALSNYFPERGHESLGVALICGAALVHPFCFVLTEKILADKQRPVSIELLCSVMGLSGLLVYGIWQLVYTVPRWERLVTEEIEEHQGSIPLISLGYCALVLVNLAHTMCFFHYILKLGSVSVSVMKGVQATLLFVCSHLVFCGAAHPSQCWTRTKTESMLVTFAGVLLYGTGSVSQGQQDSGVCFGLSSCVSSACRRLTGLPPASSSTFPSALISEPREGYGYRSTGPSKSYRDREAERAREWYLAQERDAWTEAEEKGTGGGGGEGGGGTWLEMVPLNSRDLIPSPVLTHAAPYQRQTEKYSTSMMGAFSDSTGGSAGSEGVTPQRRHSGRYTPIQPTSHMYNYESIPVAPLSPREWQWHGGLRDTRAWNGSVGYSDSDSAAAVTRVSSTGSAPTSASATATERAIRSQQAHMRAQAAGLSLDLEPQEEGGEGEGGRKPPKKKKERIFPWESTKASAASESTTQRASHAIVPTVAAAGGGGVEEEGSGSEEDIGTSEYAYRWLYR